jgi:hypothetical protein
MALSICWNGVRGDMTSAIWNVIERPWRTIFAPIFTNRPHSALVGKTPAEAFSATGPTGTETAKLAA